MRRIVSTVINHVTRMIDLASPNCRFPRRRFTMNRNALNPERSRFSFRINAEALRRLAPSLRKRNLTMGRRTKRKGRSRIFFIDGEDTTFLLVEVVGVLVVTEEEENDEVFTGLPDFFSSSNEASVVGISIDIILSVLLSLSLVLVVDVGEETGDATMVSVLSVFVSITGLALTSEVPRSLRP